VVVVVGGEAGAGGGVPYLPYLSEARGPLPFVSIRPEGRHAVKPRGHTLLIPGISKKKSESHRP
jgi:hypothetical protein